jgi:hypothetical protein
LAGIVLVGSPDIFPQAERFSAWLRASARRLRDRVLRLIGRRRPVVVSGTGAGAMALGGHARGVKSIPEDASLEEKVAYLLMREQETQLNVSDLQIHLADLGRESAERLEELRGRMEGHVADALRAAHERYLGLRLFGIVVLAVGLVCATAANFV